VRARLTRLAGALLLELGEQYFLIGNTKMPCDFPAVGFADPGTIDALQQPVLRLHARRAIELAEPYLSFQLDAEPEAIAERVAERLVIQRNGSVSDRLWRLILNPEMPEDDPLLPVVAATWLLEMPKPIWDIVRDTVLRCL